MEIQVLRQCIESRLAQLKEEVERVERHLALLEEVEPIVAELVASDSGLGLGVETGSNLPRHPLWSDGDFGSAAVSPGPERMGIER